MKRATWLVVALLGAGCTGQDVAPDNGQTDETPGFVAPTTIDEVRTPPVLQEFGFGGDFALTAHDGTTFDLAEHRGEVFLLFFGYTNCPDFCPTTLSLLAQVHEILGEEAAEVQTLFVTIDPERDTADKLAEYLGYFSVPTLGLRGSVEQVNRVVASYAGMVQSEETESGVLFGHTTYTYLIDHYGKVRYLFRADDTPLFIAAGLREQIRISRGDD